MYQIALCDEIADRLPAPTSKLTRSQALDRVHVRGVPASLRLEVAESLMIRSLVEVALHDWHERLGREHEDAA